MHTVWPNPLNTKTVKLWRGP